MNKTVIFIGALTALFVYSQASASPTAPTRATGGPVFPAANPGASPAIPAGAVVYVSNDGVKYWHYLDSNGFDHYVIGLNDVAFITDYASRTMNRRTGALSESDTDHRPNLTPLAVNISLNGLKTLG
jgi:hypothetical protein